MTANQEINESHPFQISHSDCIKSAKTGLIVMGSERRSIGQNGWIGEQQTGQLYVIAFSLLPVEVEFEGEQAMVLAPPTVALAKPETGYTRSAQNSRGQRTIFFGISSQTANDICAMHARPARNRSDPFPAKFGPCPARALAMAVQLERLVFESGQLLEPLVFEEHAMQIVDCVLGVACNVFRTKRQPKEKNTLRLSVGRVIASICNDPSRNWSLGELATSVELSPGYLSRSFRRNTGRTLSQCLQLIRVSHALEQLPDRRGELTALALDCGFASHSHMSTVFSSLLGVSPNQLMSHQHASIRSSMDCINKHLERLRGFLDLNE